MSTVTHRVILDTDPGIDDALAFFLGFASPEIRFEAITTVSGNVHVDMTSTNALSLLEIAGHPEIPVARGSADPLIRPFVNADKVHGSNGVGEYLFPPRQTTVVQQPASAVIADIIMKNPGEITLVAVGPLTNLALALRQEPRIAQTVREVVIMGGALKVPGNITPAAEFNIFADPHAAHVVFHAGWPIRLVSMDVTEQVRLGKEHITALRDSSSPVAICSLAMIDYHLDQYAGPRGVTTMALHDPLCLASVIQPEFITWEPAYIDIELHGTATFGETVAYFQNHASIAPGAPNIRASVAVDAEAARAFFLERLHRYIQQ
jgi:purine nucleosidase